MAMGLENPLELRGKRGQAAAAERGALRKASSSWQPHPRQQGREPGVLQRRPPGKALYSLLFLGDKDKKGRACLPEVARRRTGVSTWLTKGQ